MRTRAEETLRTLETARLDEAFAYIEALETRVGRLRDDLHEETRRRESEDYQLEHSISDTQRSTENAQRTADSTYSAAQHSGSRW